jgi:enoyl-CoA hydratase
MVMGDLEKTVETADIVRLTLNRPDSLNALNKNLLRSIPEAIREAGENDRLVIIFEGAGEAFTSGADLKEADEEDEEVELFQELTRAVREFEGIVIGKLHGYAIGGGFEWTLSFDIRYATPDAIFRLTESEIGLAISNASTKLLPLTVGYGTARELVFTGREVSGAEAAEMGLVAGAFEPEELERKVMSVAEDITENKSRNALVLNKRGLNEAFGLESTLEYERLLGIEVKYLRKEHGDDIDW